MLCMGGGQQQCLPADLTRGVLVQVINMVCTMAHMARHAMQEVHCWLSTACTCIPHGPLQPWTPACSAAMIIHACMMPIQGGSPSAASYIHRECNTVQQAKVSICSGVVQC